jgi:hypothetical protein
VPTPVLPIPSDMITGFGNLTLVLPFHTPEEEEEEAEWAEPEGAGHKVPSQTLSVSHSLLCKKLKFAKIFLLI